MDQPWDATEVVVITDDELVALAAGAEADFWGRIVTVQAEDTTDLSRAVARGQRSLAVRGLLTKDGLPDPLLETVRSCLGLAPWALASPVDDEARLDPAAALLLVFSAGERDIAWRSDPTGTHVVAPMAREQALGVLAEQLVAAKPGGPARTAVTLANAAGQGVGGFIRSARGIVQVDNDGVELGDPVEQVGATDLAAVQAQGSEAGAS